MKTIKILLVIISAFLFIHISLFCQDKEPEQIKFLYKGDSVFLNSQHPDFVQDSFMLGWHWGGSKKISHSLNMNQKDISSKDFFNYEDIDSSVYLIVKSVRNYAPDDSMFYTHCDNHSQLIHAKAIQYEPTLKINSANMAAPDTNTYDNTDPIFGFKYIRGRVENDVSDHRSRLVLTGDSLDGQVVLDEPWMSGNLFRHDKDEDPENVDNKEFLGYQWYITINLKRLNPAVDNICD